LLWSIYNTVIILIKVKDKDFNTVFNEVTGVSIKDYEKALNNDLKDNWKRYIKMNRCSDFSDSSFIFDDS
jgi:hypothetical protein